MTVAALKILVSQLQDLNHVGVSIRRFSFLVAVVIITVPDMAGDFPLHFRNFGFCVKKLQVLLTSFVFEKKDTSKCLGLNGNQEPGT